MAEPYSPNTLNYWRVFNDRQLELGGDPFVGAKLGNLLQAVGYRDVVTEVKIIHLDNRHPAERPPPFERQQIQPAVSAQ